MSLLRTVQLRNLVDHLCAAIDAGEVQPTEQEMMALAEFVDREGGLLKHDLLVKLASRCEKGRAALKDLAQ